ncbi:MAG: Xaa-Pro aminopeptidase [Alphaproteobacteria bacterium]|nr:MAG: Xaa-Pro aminopeptidase [Alphaproteobacteria bacterium]
MASTPDDLRDLLKGADSGMGSGALATLLDGVVAAPPGEDPDAWMMLLGAALDPATRTKLRALKEARARAARAAAATPAESAERLAALRGELARRGVAGFLVPRADEHQGEYVPPRAERLAWLTGFTGSAGLAAVLPDRAAIFVDGRYTLQVRDQVDPALFEPRHVTDQPVERWIAENLPKGAVLGYDPWLHTVEGVARLQEAAAKAGGSLQPLPDNPLDAVWTDQPPPPIAPVVPHELAYAGRSAAEKRQELGAKLAADGLDAAVLTLPDSIAWLLNIRGGDVPHTPLPLSFAVLHRDGTVDLFIERLKLAPGLERHFGNGVAIHAPAELGAALDRLGEAKARVLADPASAPAWVFDRLTRAGSAPVRAEDPCALPKACKNPVEIAGTRSAHRRDGAAIVRFLCWLDAEAPKGAVTELEAAERLHGCRRENALFRDLSFDTIAGAGPNGAIVHYRSTEKTNRKLAPGEIFLLDSGAQYLDGTTDITRTMIVGRVPDGPLGAEMRDRFTRVLKGHIAIATARFPKGTSGSQLDTLARAALWQAGLDYDHGTGHGVGSYLGVHEGPQRISKLPNRVGLEPGMIVSNEPGYYKTGAYGIRIENLVVVTALDMQGAEREMRGFETLTLAPIDRRLIEPSLLTDGERAWLDAYHAHVRDELTPLVDTATAQWLAEATRPIG